MGCCCCARCYMNMQERKKAKMFGVEDEEEEPEDQAEREARTKDWWVLSRSPKDVKNRRTSSTGFFGRLSSVGAGAINRLSLVGGAMYGRRKSEVMGEGTPSPGRKRVGEYFNSDSIRARSPRHLASDAVPKRVGSIASLPGSPGLVGSLALPTRIGSDDIASSIIASVTTLPAPQDSFKLPQPAIDEDDVESSMERKSACNGARLPTLDGESPPPEERAAPASLNFNRGQFDSTNLEMGPLQPRAVKNIPLTAARMAAVLDPAPIEEVGAAGSGTRVVPLGSGQQQFLASGKCMVSGCGTGFRDKSRARRESESAGSGPKSTGSGPGRTGSNSSNSRQSSVPGTPSFSQGTSFWTQAGRDVQGAGVSPLASLRPGSGSHVQGPLLRPGAPQAEIRSIAISVDVTARIGEAMSTPRTEGRLSTLLEKRMNKLNTPAKRASLTALSSHGSSGNHDQVQESLGFGVMGAGVQGAQGGRSRISIVT